MKSMMPYGNTGLERVKRRRIRSDVSGAIRMVTDSSRVHYRIYINYGVYKCEVNHN